MTVFAVVMSAIALATAAWHPCARWPITQA